MGNFIKLAAKVIESDSICKNIETFIKTNYRKTEKTEILPQLFDNLEMQGGNLNKQNFENSFEHFELQKDSPKPDIHNSSVSEKYQTLIKFKEFKINGKIGKPGQKDRLTFSSLIFQIFNGQKKGYSDSEICDAVVKSIDPDLALRTYLEGKEDLTLKSLSKILRTHFKEANATTLFNELSNAKQLPSESAQEFVVRIMSLRQKILFVSNN